MSLLRFRNVGVLFGNHVVLERIDLALEAGAFCAVVGPSGCGKTTLLRLLLGVARPSTGEILLDGQKLSPEPGADRGIVFQRYSVFPHLTVLKNCMLAAEFRGAACFARLRGQRRRAAADEAMALLDAVGLAGAATKYPHELSGGMRQRLSLAQSLLPRPRILLLDEPFGALDPGTKIQMYELITRLWREERITVFMVTHDLKEGFTLGTRVLTFDKTRIDPTAPGAYGATITYNLKLTRKTAA
jgi:NitT/TauT family transport system ATP-binding protein